MDYQLLVIQMCKKPFCKTLYFYDLQYTRKTVITKDWTHDEIIPHAKHNQKIFHCNYATPKL